ncbi:hypothetical protein O181_035030 [Austropuccinia psidii MF-1]|uniref:Integrase catalytic domain-containing protein n=1 Tax=Austropuccinia psidii MF-1 TaxID=1389203 RepID=A0A9Q3D417_9BASI|nr:hypothetical protein [Austropuccinia psidii MF-1]
MDWVTALPLSGDRIYNSCLVIVERYPKNCIFLLCHKDDTAMDTALPQWNRVISHTGFFGTKLSFPTEYHPQTDGLADRMIQTSEEMLRRFCQTPAMLEKGWNTRLIEEILRKDLIEIHPTACSFNIILENVKNHAKQRMNHTCDYEKKKWDKSHKVPDFKVGDLALVSTLNFNKIKGPKKLKDSYVGPFFIVALHRINAAKVEFSD